MSGLQWWKRSIEIIMIFVELKDSRTCWRCDGVKTISCRGPYFEGEFVGCMRGTGSCPECGIKGIEACPECAHGRKR